MSLISSLTRPDFEEFIYNEADLLDNWNLLEWRALFAPECRYYVPNPGADPYASPQESLYLVADDAHHLTERVKRLGKRTAHAEHPRSSTQRVVTNVRLIESSSTQAKVGCRFITHRATRSVIDTYFGRHEYIFVMDGTKLLILEKRTILGMEALRPHGKLSIIL